MGAKSATLWPPCGHRVARISPIAGTRKHAAVWCLVICQSAMRCSVSRMVQPTSKIDGSRIDNGIHDEIRAAMSRGPVAVDETSGAVVVLRYRDLESLAHNPCLAGVGLTIFDFLEISDGPLRDWYSGLMFTNEGDTHRRLRHLVQKAFTPRSVERLRADATAESTRRMTTLAAAGGGDLINVFRQFSTWMMCRLIGVPERDVALFGNWLDALSPVFGLMEPAQITAANEAITELSSYVGGLVERRRVDPGDALVDGLISASVDGDQLTHDEVVGMIANLLVGGHDTTESQLACVMLQLIRHTEQLARVRADRALVAPAVSEAIRIEPSLPIIPRTVAESFDLYGDPLAVGSWVWLCVAAANRDPDVWTDPDTFDVGRFTQPGTPKLLSFGAGAHYCLGANLARLTMEQAVASIAAGPLLEAAADPFAATWRQVLGRSPQQLPVTLH